MRNPPDRDPSFNPSDENSAARSSRSSKPNQGGRRARTIRDMFSLDQPLRRLTNIPARRRRPNAPPREQQRTPGPPDRYDADGYEGGPPDLENSRRARWTAPGASLVAAQRTPDQTDPRGPNGDPRDPRNAMGRFADPAAGAPHRPGEHGEAPDMRPDTRWNTADLLDQGSSFNSGPPITPAPPTRPRYGPGPGPGQAPGQAPGPDYGRDDQAARTYRPLDDDEPQRQQTDYRATSVRAAFWASRTPSYQPDQPPSLTDREDTAERTYFESYDTRRAPASLAHAQASLSGGQQQTYTPGATSEVERLRREEQTRGRTAGPAPYFWEMSTTPRRSSSLAVGAFWLVSLLLIVSALLTAAYSGVSVYAASQLVYAPQVAPKGTPADAGLAYKEVTFSSRTDFLTLRGWFIPGVSSPGHLTTRQTIIVVHGIRANRADPGAGLLDLSDALAKHGFAVLAFDMRGSGESASAPTSLGYYEQRDVLGAVDFLQSGTMPYPALGRPKAIGGLGISMGAATLLMAAAQEPALRAIVSDSAYADVTPILQREIPARSHLSGAFTPGILEAAQAMYGIDYYADRPAASVARIAPRPILFIHGAADTYVPPDNMTTLAQAAQQATGSHVQTWLVPNAKHAQAFHVAGNAYVSRIVAFFAANLTPAS